MDVAAAARVSRGTVSRVLNGGHWVSPEAAAAVARAIEETGFQANQYARSLVTGRANSVAFLLTEPQHLLFEDPNFSILLRGAAQALAAKGMPLLLMVAGTRDEQQQVLRYVGAGHVDGVLLISSTPAARWWTPWSLSACRPSPVACRWGTRAPSATSPRTTWAAAGR